MDKEIMVKEKLASLRALEGEEFEIDEAAVSDEYLKKEADSSSLAIKILSILGGILATLAFIGFLMLAGLYDSEIGLVIFGVGFIGTAILLNKCYDTLLIDTFSISLFATGFALLAFGLAQVEMGENAIAILLMAIALGALFITQNYLLSFISVLFINASLLFLIINNEVYSSIHLYVAIVTLFLSYHFLNEAKMITSHKDLSRLYDPIRIGLVVSLLAGLILVGKRNFFLISFDLSWVSSLVIIPLVLYLISRVLNVLKVNSPAARFKVILGSAIVLLPTFFAPAIAGGLLILLLSYLVNYKTGVVIGIMALVYFIFQCYYDLNLTLLVKSGILFSSGVLFLLFYLFIHKKLSTNEKV